jgi:hypothetical protein
VVQPIAGDEIARPIPTHGNTFVTFSTIRPTKEAIQTGNSLPGIQTRESLPGNPDG